DARPHPQPLPRRADALLCNVVDRVLREQGRPLRPQRPRQHDPGGRQGPDPGRAATHQRHRAVDPARAKYPKWTMAMTRWALLGKQAGRRGDYALLGDSSGGRQSEELLRNIRQLILGNPADQPPDAPGALPWVSVGITSAGSRVGIAIMEWPDRP